MSRGFTFTEEHNRSWEMSVCKHIRRLRFIGHMRAGRCTDKHMISTDSHSLEIHTQTQTQHTHQPTHTHTHTHCIRKWPFVSSLFLSKQHKWCFHESHAQITFSLCKFCEKWQRMQRKCFQKQGTTKKRATQRRIAARHFIRAVTYKLLKCWVLFFSFSLV